MSPHRGRRPLRVLFVSGTPLGTATCRYRCEHLAEALRARGDQADVVYIGQPRVRIAHDIVVLYRVCATGEGRRFARAARSCGAVLVYSTDDVVFNADEAPAQMGKRFQALAPSHREMLAEADAALASTQYLRDLMREAVPETPVYTVRNFLGSDLVLLSEAARRLRESRAEPTPMMLGYLSGSPTHDEDLAAVAEPLRRVLEENPQAELLVVGPVRLPQSLRAREAAGQIRRAAAVPWKSLPALIIERGIRVNLAPLDLSRRFCHAKSEVKYLEAAALGIPTVASASKGFQEAIPDPNGREGCFLAADTDEWERWLNFLIQHNEECARSGTNAREYTLSTGASETSRKDVAAVFETLACLRDSAGPSEALGQIVNWPFSARYALKSVIESGTKLLQRLSAPGQKRQDGRTRP